MARIAGAGTYAASACTGHFDELVAAASLSSSDSATDIQRARRSLTKLFAHVAEHPRDPAAAFAVLGSVIDWLRHGCPGTAKQMAAVVSPHLIAAVSASQPG